MLDTSTAPQKAKPSRFQNLKLILKVALVCSLIFPALLSEADTTRPHDNSLQSLRLTCSVHSDNYGLEEGLLATKEVTLTSSSLSEGGRELVYKDNQLAFWVMIHMAQKLGNKHFINNFEVAIRDVESGQSYNALSDSVFSPGRVPKSARIRMTTYYPDSFHEEGYVMLECRNEQSE